MKTNKNKHTGDLFGITPCLDCDGEGHTVEEIRSTIFNESFPMGEEEVTCESCNGTGVQ